MSREGSVFSRRWLGRFALGATTVLLALVAIMLPIAAHSMWTELLQRGETAQYDALSGELVTFSDDDVARPDVSYVNLVVTAIDAANQLATIELSGNLGCTDPC